MLKRSYELFSFDLKILATFGAYKAETRKQARELSCSFSYEQSMVLTRVQKRNTILFEQLSGLVGLPYTVSANISTDFLYDAVFVEMNTVANEDIFCFLDEKQETVETMSGEALKEWIFHHGFTMTGVPVRDDTSKKRPEKRNGTQTESVHYLPFVSSASMARKGLYLFVNERYYAELMQQLTLDFFGYDEKTKRLYMPTKNRLGKDAIVFQNKYKVSAAKMSAYLGLMLSDGVSVREMAEIWRLEHPDCEVKLPELSEETVFVADDLEMNAQPFYADKGPFAWVIEGETQTDVTLPVGAEPVDEQADQATDELIRFFQSFKSADAHTEYLIQAGRKKRTGVWQKWKTAVEAYLTEEAHNSVDYTGLLPAPVDDAGQFRTHLGKYAYLWGCGLMTRLRKTPGLLWPAGVQDEAASDLPMLKESVLCAIGMLGDNESARNTLKNLVNNRKSLCFACAKVANYSNKQRPQYAIWDGVVYETTLKRNEQVFSTSLKPTAEMGKYKLNMFDGMGLCDNETFDRLEMLLTGKETLPAGDKRRYSALVIRLPWLKGVLVRCDFQAFFRDKAQGGTLPDRVTDIFGKERELKKISIIINKSMLKGIKYLQNLENTDDSWKLYWERISAYKIPLLITGRNSEPGRRTNLNYQFLSTLGLDDDSFKALCDAHAEKACKYLLDKKQQLAYFTRTAADKKKQDDEDAELFQEADAADDAAVTDTDEIFGRALKAELKRLGKEKDKEPDCPLLKTRYARASVQGYVRSLLLDGMLGRLEVQGDYRFIAPDLLCMLHYLYDRYVEQGQFKADKYKLHSAINAIGPDVPGNGYYYAPGQDAPWRGEKINKETGETDRWENDLVALRNPHYAMGEAAIVSPLQESDRAEYDRWFGHLDSVIMLPAVAMGTMGGADVDGDRACCVSEPKVVKAAKAAIRENKATLQYMIDHRQEYLDWLEPIKENAQKPFKDYAENLENWLKNYIPKEFTGVWKANYCPALIFGDANSRSVDFAPTEQHIEKYIYDSFILTTQQRIGLLSVEALRYAGNAYQVNRTLDDNPAFEQSGGLTNKQYQQLHAWLYHWRMVSLALENGCEIDMAKTGVKCVAPQLRVRIDFKDHEKKAGAGYKSLWSLEECSQSILRIFEEREERAFDGVLTRKKQGQQFARGLLADLLMVQEGSDTPSLVDKSRELEKRGHNNVNMLPYRLYTAFAQAQEKRMPDDSKAKGRQESQPDGSEEEVKLLTAFHSPSGPSLQQYLIRAMREQRKGQSETCGTVQETVDAADNTGACSAQTPGNEDQAKGTVNKDMEALAWAKHAERAAALQEYIERRAQLTMTEEQAAALKANNELLDDEQGVYFFKEALKFLYQSSEAAISDTVGNDSNAKTPFALRDEISALIPDQAQRPQQMLQMVAAYDGTTYNPSILSRVNDMNDYLFLALAGEHFVAACRSGRWPAPLQNIDAYPQMKALVQQYAAYKARIAMQATERSKMNARYSYCVRNLQRRYSLAKALKTMNKYNQGVADSPLDAMGITAAQLKRLYMYLEDKK